MTITISPQALWFVSGYVSGIVCCIVLFYIVLWREMR